MGLTSTYDVIRTQILNSTPLPSLNKAYAMVISEETQRQVNLSYSTGEGSSAMMVKSSQGKNDTGPSKRGGVSKKDKYCDHCKVNGHTRDACFKLHGYPDWWKEMKEKKGPMQKKQAANLTSEGLPDTPVVQESESSTKGELANMVSYLMKEVQRLNKTKGKEEQDQTSEKVLAKGTAVRNLYYLNVTNQNNDVSLVSLEKHGCSNSSSISVNDSVKDNYSSSLNDQHINKSCNTVKDSNNQMIVNAWHFRLGHASLNVLKRINGISILDVAKTMCEACHNAKQARLSFSLSETRSESRLELLHVDLWGPYKVPTITGAHYFLTIVDDHTRATWTFLLNNKTQPKELVTVPHVLPMTVNDEELCEDESANSPVHVVDPSVPLTSGNNDAQIEAP
ncbi:Retrovirus-related Pol polyprotein from transposon TNT 1-94 [Senna tora]|uniref:Retrovirus-related Pol polyprotein from transposon TNT 1-94 n=1 Tax=Senna tora TaxID=362788 RepID=A0A834TTE5_9FABA|nr:Retrovirus-related Pol polyprotein from transposon TNT 1-94 [Senna tora]